MEPEEQKTNFNGGGKIWHSDPNPPLKPTNIWTATEGDISSLILNSTIKAILEYRRIRAEKKTYKKNKQKIEKIKTQIYKNYEGQAKSETRVLISDALLKFAPTFVFGVWMYSFVTNPNNILISLPMLIVFLCVLYIFYDMRIRNQANLYKIDNAQNELVTELKELFNPQKK